MDLYYWRSDAVEVDTNQTNGTAKERFAAEGASGEWT
jgi:hypothetical protein